MLSKELLSRIRKIEIRTRRLVEELTAGAYHSVFKGSGIEFDEVREYTPDDDVRDIDWNVTARMGSPFVKKYAEERELNVMILVDVSPSGDFGSGLKSKAEVNAEIAALIALSAMRNHDKVGLLTFTDRIETYVPPKSGRVHGLRLIRDLMAGNPVGSGTDIGHAFAHLMRVMKKKAVVFLLSDLMDDHDWRKMLAVANRRHDVVAIRVLDPAEFQLPLAASMGMAVEDAETGRAAFFPGLRSSSIAAHAKAAEALHARNADLCVKAKVDLVDVRCGEDLVKPLMAFFRRRERMAAR